MNKISAIIICLLLFCQPSLLAQEEEERPDVDAVEVGKITHERIKASLEVLLSYEKNNNLDLVDLTRQATSKDHFNARDYDKVKAAYNKVAYAYNRVYLAKIKKDVTRFGKLKKLTKKTR